MDLSKVYQEVDVLYKQVAEKVKEAQGDRPFILTDCSDKDAMWAIVHFAMSGCAMEKHIKAIKFDGDLQIVVSDMAFHFDEEKIDKCAWFSVKGDYIHYIPTLLSIALNIESYL